MAKIGFLKNIKKYIALKKKISPFLLLAMLFIISIVLFFIFKNYTIEYLDNGNNIDGSGNKIDGSGNKIDGSGNKIDGSGNNIDRIGNIPTNISTIDKAKTRIEVALVSSEIQKHREHMFSKPGGDWTKLVNKYKTNPKITTLTIDKNNINSVLENINLNYSNNDLPMVIFSVFLNDKRYYGGQLTQTQATFNSADSYLNLLINTYLL
jgi:hypothetical protein